MYSDKDHEYTLDNNTNYIIINKDDNNKSTKYNKKNSLSYLLYKGFNIYIML